MYDLVIVRKLNKKKVAILIIILILLVVLSTLSGIKYADYKQKKAYEESLAKQIEEAERIKKEEEEKKERQRKEQIQSYKNKVTQALTEEQKENILHIYRSTGEKRVYLTFDDGPSNSVTPLILDVLKEYNVKATFFVLGTNAKYNPELIKREFEEGHYIANHGYSHKYSEIYSSPEATLEEYCITESIIREILEIQNFSSKLFRFPGGSNGGYYDEAKQNSKAYLRENGIVHLDWNCLSKDAEGAKSKEEVLQNIIDTMGEKDSVIILMHDASDKILTYEMLPSLITYLQEKGYTFKNIYDLL